jgi:hypothetical protein
MNKLSDFEWPSCKLHYQVKNIYDGLGQAKLCWQFLLQP